MTKMFQGNSQQKRMEKKKIKQQKKRRKRVSLRIERMVSFLGVLVCVVFSVLEVLEERKSQETARRKCES